MKAVPSEEQELLCATVSNMVSRQPTPVPNYGESLPVVGWDVFCEAGLTAVGAPDRPGLSAVDIALVCEQLGRHLSTLPYIGACILPSVLIAGINADHPLLDDLASGAQLPVAMTDDLCSVAVEPEGIAIDCGDAERAIALGASGIRLVEISLERLPAADLTRSVRRVTESNVSSVGGGPPSAAVLERWRTMGLVALCADTLGVIAGALDEAVAYASDRRQFGQAIGSFQAIQHLCADQLVNVEAARSVTYHAAWASDHLEPDEAAVIARRAKIFVDHAARKAVEANVQVHGGVGFTWDALPHLRLRRVALNRIWIGDPDALAREEGQRFAMEVGHG